jgi:hypothetical protein
MVVPISSSVPNDGLATYQSVLHRAIDVFTSIIEIYQPDIHSPCDWADITVSEATSQRNGLRERLAILKLSTIYTVSLVSTLGHYLDTHWADYERVLTPNPAKRQQVEQLHATLENLIKEIAPLSNALKAQEQANKLM